VWSEALEKLKALAASWSVYAALGSFVLYFLGYLVLRFQLSTWGVATDLSVLDERYFFAGARFLVYLVTTIANVALLAAPVFVLWWLINRWPRFRQWREGWDYALIGLVFSVLFIELLGRKCFAYMNSLLVQRQLAGDQWVKNVLCDTSPTAETFFFAALVAGVGLSGWLLVQCQSQKIRRPMLESLLSFFFGVALLLLPVNYGIVVATRTLAKVTNFAPAEAWLVWEGADKTTFLVVDKDRKLVAVPNGELKTLEITGVDEIFQRLFPECTAAP
jgi:hypothetical protein